MPDRLDSSQMALRVAQELTSGEAVALGLGLPTLLPEAVSPGSGLLFVSESGAVGYRMQGESALDAEGRTAGFIPGGVSVSTVELAAMVRAGYVDTVVLQPGQVTGQGDFTHWTTTATPGLSAASWASEYASGPVRVIAMMPHTDHNGNPTIVSQSTMPLDGRGCVSLIVTDVAVIRLGQDGLTLEEVAPGWSSDDVTSITGGPLTVSPDLREMTFDTPRFQQPSKVFPTALEAIRDLPNGATVFIDGFAGPGGMPHCLLVALRDHGASGLTMVSNTAGIARVVGFGTPPGRQAIDHSILIDNHQIKKAIASYPVSPSPARPSSFELALQRGEVECEVVPQGTLAERLRAGGAGVAAFYTPTGVGTLLAEGKEVRSFDGKDYVLEQALRGDFCLIRGHKADTLGNVVYKGTSRNFNSVMAPAARVTVIEVDEVVEPGALSPDEIVTPGVYIDRIVVRPPGFSHYE